MITLIVVCCITAAGGACSCVIATKAAKATRQRREAELRDSRVDGEAAVLTS